MNDAVDAMLRSPRAFVVAPAGCGKTELLGRVVADVRSGRQLVLTHTHAGVAAIRRRLAELRVPADKYQLDTIAGWSTRFGAAYPAISGLRLDADGTPEWSAVSPGATRLCLSSLGRRIVRSSYNGVLIDEYQDCSVQHHRLVMALLESIPCRGVGDPLQSVFNFRKEPTVDWQTIVHDFEVMDGLLTEPWRWRRPGRNQLLGEWLVRARNEIATTGELFVGGRAPVKWVRHVGEPSKVWSDACRRLGYSHETAVAIVERPPQCIALAKGLGGRWPVVERFDSPDLLKLAAEISSASGPVIAAALVNFVAERMTHIGHELKTGLAAISEGRGLGRISKHRAHIERLQAVAQSPSPDSVLLCLDGLLAEQEWFLYRPECVHQLRSALRECAGRPIADVSQAAVAARTRIRHRGRRAYRHSIGTPLLVKGLEFDHAVVLWEPEHLTREGLYVAITRGSKSLTIVSASSTLKTKSA